MFQAYLARPAAHTLLTGLSRLCDQTLKQIWAAHDLPKMPRWLRLAATDAASFTRNPMSMS
jgi:hypothetical protein